MIEDLAEDGVYVTVYCNPHLIEGSLMFEEAVAAGHFLTDTNGEVFLQDFGGFLAGTIDLLDTDSAAWYGGKVGALSTYRPNENFSDPNFKVNILNYLQ